MQLLVTFWRDCGLITGQRLPPSPQWPDSNARIRGLDQPQYLKDRLRALSTESRQTQDQDKYKKSQFIELTRLKEALLNTSTEPSGSDPPFPQTLMDELDIVWQSYNTLEPDEQRTK